MMEFCELVLKIYPSHIQYNPQKIKLLVTLSSVVNARIQKFKYIQNILDPRLSTKPEGMTSIEWENKQRELIGRRVQTKMLTWLTTLKTKPAGEDKNSKPLSCQPFCDGK